MFDNLLVDLGLKNLIDDTEKTKSSVLAGRGSVLDFLEHHAKSCHIPRTWDIFLIQAAVKTRIRDNSGLRYLMMTISFFSGPVAFLALMILINLQTYLTEVNILMGLCSVRRGKFGSG